MSLRSVAADGPSAHLGPIVVIALGISLAVGGASLGCRKRDRSASLGSASASASASSLVSAPPSGIVSEAAASTDPGLMALIPGGRRQDGKEVSPFRLHWTEVTRAQYAACVYAGACSEPKREFNCNYSDEGKHDHPINCVTHAQAQTYCAWAGGRLPTQEEWDYAARGVDGRIMPWGNERDPSAGCFVHRLTCPVRSYPWDRSPFGVWNMAGNVNEWTDKVIDGRAVLMGGRFFTWTGPTSDSEAWDVFIRGWSDPESVTTVSYQIGFRCAKTLEPGELAIPHPDPYVPAPETFGVPPAATADVPPLPPSEWSLPSSPSDRPSVLEWNDADAYPSPGAADLDCEVKFVREWIRATCRTAKASAYPIQTAKVNGWTRRPAGYADFIQTGTASVVFPIRDPIDATVVFTWSEFTKGLHVWWNEGSAQPAAVFDLGPGHLGSRKFKVVVSAQAAPKPWLQARPIWVLPTDPPTYRIQEGAMMRGERAQLSGDSVDWESALVDGAFAVGQFVMIDVDSSMNAPSIITDDPGRKWLENAVRGGSAPYVLLYKRKNSARFPSLAGFLPGFSCAKVSTKGAETTFEPFRCDAIPVHMGSLGTVLLPLPQ